MNNTKRYTKAGVMISSWEICNKKIGSELKYLVLDDTNGVVFSIINDGKFPVRVERLESGKSVIRSVELKLIGNRTYATSPGYKSSNHYIFFEHCLFDKVIIEIEQRKRVTEILRLGNLAIFRISIGGHMSVVFDDEEVTFYADKNGGIKKSTFRT